MPHAPKASALPTALHPDMKFSNCGQTCGQRRFLTSYRRGGKCCQPNCPKAFRVFRGLRPEPGLHAPKPGAIPTSLYPDICFFGFWKFCCLWSLLWSDAIFRRFSSNGQNPQTTVCQRLPAFRFLPPRMAARHSQSRRATNCATPGYGIFNCGLTCGLGRFLTNGFAEMVPASGSVPAGCGVGLFPSWMGGICSQSKRATNCATPGYGIVLSVVFHVVLAVF